MFDKLKGKKRLLMEAELVPIQGDRFQPTGFPDLGGATYQLPDGTRMLLVESAQSMANHLEKTVIGADNEIVKELEGLPYVRAHLTEATETTTTSLIEAHRINSPYIITNETFQEKFREDAGYEADKSLNWQKIASALFKYDVNSLLHGTFLSNVGDGRMKVSRSISAFIEARNVREAVSGGVKLNPMDPSGKLHAANLDKNVYGNVPYQRVEYTAETIKAYFNLDVGLLESYGLNPDAFELLVGLALYKIHIFLEQGTRLRTACDLRLKDELMVSEPPDFIVPDKGKMLTHLRKMIENCKPLFPDPPVTEIKTETVLKKEEKDESDIAE